MRERKSKVIYADIVLYVRGGVVRVVPEEPCAPSPLRRTYFYVQIYGYGEVILLVYGQRQR